MDQEEQEILQVLDIVLNNASVRATIDTIVQDVEQRLAHDAHASMAWQPVPLSVYSEWLPEMIRSSWVFLLRAHATTGAERHPNSCQRMMSYRGSGDLQTRTGQEWHSHYLMSDLSASLEQRWISVPPNTWHQAVVAEENWVVVSFHTAPEHELIEERPDLTDAGGNPSADISGLRIGRVQKIGGKQGRRQFAPYVTRIRGTRG